MNWLARLSGLIIFSLATASETKFNAIKSSRDLDTILIKINCNSESSAWGFGVLGFWGFGFRV